jgi:hypothetical protein
MMQVHQQSLYFKKEKKYNKTYNVIVLKIRWLEFKQKLLLILLFILANYLETNMS